VSRDAVFVGVTSWNSSLFLGACLRSVHAVLGPHLAGLMVYDNASTDGSAQLARSLGACVTSRRVPQAEAMNALVAATNAPFTLLLHADVVLLAKSLHARCRTAVEAGAALVSPEDIGCGPRTRLFGAGRPESSFLWFETAVIRRLRRVLWRRRWRLPYPVRRVDFYGPHVTHRLPDALAHIGARMRLMRVHASDRVSTPVYVPDWEGPAWWHDLFLHRYGLGNFYSLDGCVTHYHNWYDRIPKDVNPSSRATAEADGQGVPIAFLRAYSQAFLNDLANGTLVLPDVVATEEVGKS